MSRATTAVLAGVLAVVALSVGAATVPSVDYAAPLPDDGDGELRERTGSGTPQPRPDESGGESCPLGCPGGLDGLPGGVLAGLGRESAAVVAVLAGTLLGAVYVAYRASGGSDDPGATGATGLDDDRPAGECGSAEDPRPADAPATNEVYRAWRTFADRVGVPNRTAATPREYAAAATDEGFPADAVAELRETFAAVRYGGESPTGERERRATAARRRLDAASDDADPGSDHARPDGEDGEDTRPADGNP